jgi:hypothetical protein
MLTNMVNSGTVFFGVGAAVGLLLSTKLGPLLEEGVFELREFGRDPPFFLRRFLPVVDKVVVVVVTGVVFFAGVVVVVVVVVVFFFFFLFVAVDVVFFFFNSRLVSSDAKSSCSKSLRCHWDKSCDHTGIQNTRVSWSFSTHHLTCTESLNLVTRIISSTYFAGLFNCFHILVQEFRQQLRCQESGGHKRRYRSDENGRDPCESRPHRFPVVQSCYLSVC